MSRRIASSVLRTCCVAGCLLIAYAADAGTLTGRVTNQSSAGVASATVEILSTSTAAVLATGTTSAAGNYSIGIADGTYDVRVTPPPASGLGTAVALGVTVAGTTTHDFVLAPSSAAVLSGRLIDGLGLGIGGETLALIPDGGEIGVTAVTDAVGQFRFDVAPGAYRLVVNGTNHAFSVNGPEVYSLLTEVFTITGSQSADFRLPVKRVDVHVQRPDTTAAPGVGISSSNAFNCGMPFGPTTACGASNYSFTATSPQPPGSVTNGSGNEVLWLFPTPSSSEIGNPFYSIIAIPPANSGFAATTVTGIVVAGPTAVTITLATPITISGRLLDFNNGGMPNQVIQLVADESGAAFSVTTDVNGNYQFDIAPGTFRFVISGNNNDFANAAPQFFTVITSPFTVSSTTAIDLKVPAVSFPVHVQDGLSAPVAGAGVSTTAIFTCSLQMSTSPAIDACGTSNYFFTGGTTPAVTNASGDITTYLFPTPVVPPSPELPSKYTFTVEPPAATGLATTSVSDVDVPGTTGGLTVMLDRPVTLSGTLQDAAATGIPNQIVELVRTGSTALDVVTDSNGAYSFGVAAGTFTLNATGDNQGFSAAAPQIYTIVGTDTFTLAADTALNLPLPVKRLTVHVQDSGGGAVRNVGFSTTSGLQTCGLAFGPGTTKACGNSFYFYFPPPPGTPIPATDVPGLTDSTGTMTLWLFPTTTVDPSDPDSVATSYDLTATPFPGSGLLPLAVQHIELLADKDITIVLPASHAAPVTTLSIAPVANPDGTYNDPVVITLSATAAPGFTVAQTLYALDGGDELTYTAPFQVTGNGTHTVRYFSVDSDGIAEAPNSFSFHIGPPDVTPPTTTATVTPAPNAAGWNNLETSVSFHAEDNAGGSGVQAVHFQVAGSPEIVTEGSDAGLTLSEEGIFTITYFAVDLEGNAETPKTLVVKIDLTGPIVQITSPTSPVITHSDVVVTSWTAVDALSGIASEVGTLDGIPVANGSARSAMTLSLGPHTLDVTATNNADLTGSDQRTFIIIATFDSLISSLRQLCAQGAINKPGTCTSLEAKLQAAAAAHARGDDRAARSILNAFLNELEAQNGKAVNQQAYALLKADALFVIASLP